MVEKYTIESHHSLMFMPFNKNRPIFAAGPLAMHNTGIRNKQNFPSPLAKTHAPVQVFAMKEIFFIQTPDLRQRLTLHHHAGTGNRLDCNRTIRQRLLMQLEIGKKLRITVAIFRQTEDADK